MFPVVVSAWMSKQPQHRQKQHKAEETTTTTQLQPPQPLIDGDERTRNNNNHTTTEADGPPSGIQSLLADLAATPPMHRTHREEHTNAAATINADAAAASSSIVTPPTATPSADAVTDALETAQNAASPADRMPEPQLPSLGAALPTAAEAEAVDASHGVVPTFLPLPVSSSSLLQRVASRILDGAALTTRLESMRHTAHADADAPTAASSVPAPPAALLLVQVLDEILLSPRCPINESALRSLACRVGASLGESIKRAAGAKQDEITLAAESMQRAIRRMIKAAAATAAAAGQMSETQQCAWLTSDRASLTRTATAVWRFPCMCVCFLCRQLL